MNKLSSAGSSQTQAVGRGAGPIGGFDLGGLTDEESLSTREWESSGATSNTPGIERQLTARILVAERGLNKIISNYRMRCLDPLPQDMSLDALKNFEGMRRFVRSRTMHLFRQQHQVIRKDGRKDEVEFGVLLEGPTERVTLYLNVDIGSHGRPCMWSFPIPLTSTSSDFKVMLKGLVLANNTHEHWSGTLLVPKKRFPVDYRIINTLDRSLQGKYEPSNREGEREHGWVPSVMLFCLLIRCEEESAFLEQSFGWALTQAISAARSAAITKVGAGKA